MNEKIAKTGFANWAIALSVFPCSGQFRHYYNIVTQIQQLFSINFNNFALTRTLNEERAAGRGSDAAESDDEILDIQVDEAKQSGPLEFLDPQQAGIDVRDAFFSA